MNGGRLGRAPLRRLTATGTGWGFNPYTAKLLMRPGNHQEAVVVSDELGGESTFVRRPVRAPERSAPPDRARHRGRAGAEER